MASKATETLLQALIWVSVAACVALLWRISSVVLLAFGAILGAMLLRMFSDAIARGSGMPHNLSLALATLIILGGSGAVIWIFGARISSQLLDVVNRAQAAEEQIRSMLEGSGFSHFLGDLANGSSSMVGAAITYALSISLSFLEGLVVLVISAIYLAAQPHMYRRGVAQLFVPRLRPWARDTLDHVGVSLRLWLLGQLILMLLVGLLSLLAVWLIGLPNPFALGLIAGLTEIVPYVGPFIGGIPAVLVALTQGLAPALWTIAAYLGIHLFEGYLVGPLIQQWFVKIPPALMLFGIVAAELTFGPFGLVLAAPLTVAVFLAVKMFYIRDTLRQPTELPGDE